MSDDAMDRKKTVLAVVSLLITVVVVVALIWAFFFNSNATSKENSSPEVSSPESTSQAGTSQLANEHSSTSKGTSHTPVTAHSHPLAGGPRPPQAHDATTIVTSNDGGSPTAIIVTPSGNIGCDITHDAHGPDGGTDSLRCAVISWVENPPVPPVPVDSSRPGYATVFMSSQDPEPVYGGWETGGMCFMPSYCEVNSKPQVVQYGDMVYFANFVCASEKSGLSCWNVKNRHGVFMSRDYFEKY